MRSRSHYDLKFIFGYIALFSFQTATALADGIPRQKRDIIQFISLFVLVKLKTEKFSTFFRPTPADPRHAHGPQEGWTNNLSHFSRLSSPKRENFFGRVHVHATEPRPRNVATAARLWLATRLDRRTPRIYNKEKNSGLERGASAPGQSRGPYDGRRDYAAAPLSRRRARPTTTEDGVRNVALSRPRYARSESS